MIKFHSDLSGRCWVPAGVVSEDHPGYYEEGVPRRLYINTDNWGTVMIGARSQVWLPILGYLPFRWTWAYWPITYRPPSRWRSHGYLIERFPHWYKYR